MKLTVPTWLTLLRIVLIPVLVVVFYLPYKWTSFAASAVFILAAGTDWLDGWIPRRYPPYSALGAFLGPVAGTFVGTPLTYPLMWLGSYRVGAWLLGHDVALFKFGADRLWSLLASGSSDIVGQAAGQAADLLAPIVKPLLIGSFVLGLAAGVAA